MLYINTIIHIPYVITISVDEIEKTLLETPYVLNALDSRRVSPAKSTIVILQAEHFRQSNQKIVIDVKDIIFDSLFVTQTL